ncbi:synaptogenesis protein syg-1-like, partial [Manduca sexta]|uniref:synaptogenesis protein syg-1-like n=1 Tax=Manduca sexta TaxID=7130 RepID=UPI00188F5FAB
AIHMNTSQMTSKQVQSICTKTEMAATHKARESVGLRARRISVNKQRKWSGRPDVLVLFVLIAGCHGHQEQRFAMEPQDQSAIIGSRVTLPCRVENKVGALQWTKDDFGLGTHRNLSGYDRYSMIGSDEE